MKRTAWFTALVLLVVSILPHAGAASPTRQEEPPYIYYYSEALNGVVIERADGTDSRIIGQGLVDEDVSFVYGPGWSPDGKWFAWRVTTPEGYFGNVGKGYVISTDGQTTLDLLDLFPCVNSMLWHPAENILFVFGTMAPANHCSGSAPSGVVTYWLINVDAQALIASFSIDTFMEWASTPSIYWSPDQAQFQFLEATLHDRGIQDFLVTMSFDGTVIMEPVSRDAAVAWSEDLLPERIGREEDRRIQFTNWVEAAQGSQIEPPPDSSAAWNVPVSGQWHAQGDWLFVGYEVCWSDCALVTGRVSIFNPETGKSREISACGGHPTCVGWLPEHVDPTNLPPGQPESVLPAPQIIDYDYGFLERVQSSGHWPPVVTHQIACNTETRKMSLVRRIATGKVDFVLPDAVPCGRPLQTQPEIVYPTERVVFALSPDNRYYAITDSRQYTSVYDAATGAKIATLNFYGIELAFSDDARTLTTTGWYATATWDIQELINKNGMRDD